MSGAPAEPATASRSEKWRARWADAIADQSVSPQAEAIADALLHDAQAAVMYSAAWQLEMTDPVKWELALSDLLDEDMAALNGLGIQVMRCLLRRDGDWAERETRYDKWFHAYYADACRTGARGQPGLHAALFLDPDVHGPLLDVAAAKLDGVTIHPDSMPIAAYLVSRGLVSLNRIGVFRLPRMPRRNWPPAYRAEATELGRLVAFHLAAGERKRAEIFADAKRSKVAERDAEIYCCGMELMTGHLGAALDGAERPAHA